MTLYLKYRPKNFESLVGQTFIKNTLKQAIIKDKLVWAYLFCWPRGTGKTSTARIFAKTINCIDLHDGNPCEKCEICQWFTDENLVDIIEIDAASYTGVDNIREIIERASFTPTKCKYKIYIIDEVHMLSKWAFNALLKILEEPPVHLKFILATTESHKIPETILSRCQRYDFKSITWEDMQERLLLIAEKEGIQIDQESLEFIIKQANGALRNAISLFEQLIYNGEIHFETVINNYGIPKNEIITNFYTKLLLKDSSLITDFENIISNYNLHLFFKELLFYIKDKLIENIWNNNWVQSHIFLLETIEEAYGKSKNSFDPKTTFLVWIIKCIQDMKPLSNTKEISIDKKISEIIPQKLPEISSDDVMDIFWDDNKEQKDLIKSAIWEKSWLVTFDIEKFIQEMKWLWVKWWVTMSLRWSSFEFDGKKLIIYTKTKIALKQIGNSDIISFIHQVFHKLWFLDINIEIK